MAISLPVEFKERMQKLLGGDAPAFFDALTFGAPVRGIRTNLLKTNRDVLLSSVGQALKPLPYTENGFVTEEDLAGIGNTPAHHAGMMYLQDPGAMATLCAVDLPRGIRAIDLCAAPGGKSSQIAEKIGEEGFLLSNEFVPKRAKITVGNFERLGIKNAFVTSLDTAEFKKYYSHFFDFVLADVPCSGEGMFRKSEEARADWNLGNVAACAKRQKEILENAAPLVKSGGMLLYSTCTWSLEENEMQIEDFLNCHPDFSLIPVKDEVKAVTADGVCYAGSVHPELKECRRFYPHLFPGEGQFMALLKRDNTGDMPTILYKSSEKPLNKEESSLVLAFLKETLNNDIKGRIVYVGGNLVLVSHDLPILPYSLFSSGVLLGEIRGKNLFPSHQFFSAYGKRFRIQIDLSEIDALRYLAGEELPVGDTRSGFCAVTYHGVVLGGGKISCGRMKNHYPKGLRNTQGSVVSVIDQ